MLFILTGCSKPKTDGGTLPFPEEIPPHTEADRPGVEEEQPEIFFDVLLHGVGMISAIVNDNGVNIRKGPG